MKKTPVCVSLDTELLDKTRKFADNTHRSVSAVVEMSLQRFLDDKNDGK
ncbi:MAG: hypothetical protein GTN40_05550 [Candidatus Aenigmarchaeota archaeon]|nr:hypothetical protein [Candidatus Aenigmarchaeota archaeon]